MIELKVTSSLDTTNWTCISLELAPEASHQRQQCGNMCQSLHWPRHGLSRLGLTTDGCKKLYLMDWKILEVNISDHDVAPFCNHLFVALWPHARQASSKEYGRLAPVNYPLCCSYWWPMHRAATRLMPISD